MESAIFNYLLCSGYLRPDLVGKFGLQYYNYDCPLSKNLMLLMPYHLCRSFNQVRTLRFIFFPKISTLTLHKNVADWGIFRAGFIASQFFYLSLLPKSSATFIKIQNSDKNNNRPFCGINYRLVSFCPKYR